MKEKGVVLLGIVRPYEGAGADPGWAKTKAVIQEFKLDFPTLVDPIGQLDKVFGIEGIPYTLIIGPDGIIKAELVGAQGETALRAALQQGGVE